MQDLKISQKPVRVKVDFPGIEHVMVLVPRDGIVEDLKKEAERTFERLLKHKSRPIENLMKDNGRVLLPSWYPIEPLIEDNQEVSPGYRPLCLPDVDSCHPSSRATKSFTNLADLYVNRETVDGRKRRRKSIHVISPSDDEELISGQVPSSTGTFKQNFRNAVSYMHDTQSEIDAVKIQPVDLINSVPQGKLHERFDGLDFSSFHTDDTLILPKTSDESSVGDKNDVTNIPVLDHADLPLGSIEANNDIISGNNPSEVSTVRNENNSSTLKINDDVAKKIERQCVVDEMPDKSSDEEIRITHKNLQKAKRKQKKANDLNESTVSSLEESQKGENKAIITSTLSKAQEVVKRNAVKDDQDGVSADGLNCKKRHKKKKKWKEKELKNSYSQESLFSEFSEAVAESRQSESASESTVFDIKQRKAKQPGSANVKVAEFLAENQEMGEIIDMTSSSSKKKSKRKRNSVENCNGNSTEESATRSGAGKRKKKGKFDELPVKDNDAGKGWDRGLPDAACKKLENKLEKDSSTTGVNEMFETEGNKLASTDTEEAKRNQNVNVISMQKNAEANDKSRSVEEERPCFDDETDNELSAIRSKIERMCNDIIPESVPSQDLVSPALDARAGVNGSMNGLKNTRAKNHSINGDVKKKESHEKNTKRKPSLDSDLSSSISFSDCSVGATKKPEKKIEEKAVKKQKKKKGKVIDDEDHAFSEEGHKENHDKKDSYKLSKSKRKRKVSAWLSQIQQDGITSEAILVDQATTVDGSENSSFQVTERKVTDLMDRNKTDKASEDDVIKPINESFDDAKDELRFESLLDDGASVISAKPAELKKTNNSQSAFVQQSINGFLSNADRKRFRGKVGIKSK